MSKYSVFKNILHNSFDLSLNLEIKDKHQVPNNNEIKLFCRSSIFLHIYSQLILNKYFLEESKLLIQINKV